jgi:hypothetical protein
MNTPSTTELVRRETIETLCNAHHDAIQEFTEAGALIARGLERINAAQIGCGYSGLHHWPHNYTPGDLADPEGMKKLQTEMQRAAWRVIVDLTGIKNLVSVAQCREIEDALHGNGPSTMPELTPENVYGWIAALGDQLPAMLKASIKEVFDFLRPRHSDLKTNSQYEIGRRVIVRWLAYPDKWTKHPQTRYDSEKEVKAVDNVFHLLDGKGPVKFPCDLWTAMKASEQRRDCPLMAETEYFRVKGYLNGNCHLEFLRPDLLQELNEIGGGRGLKHDTTAAKEWQKTPGAAVALAVIEK